MQAEPYLFFNGACDAALDFYRAAIGAEVTMKLHFRDAPDQTMIPPGAADKVMHAEVRIGATRFFASDGCDSAPAQFSGFALLIAADSRTAAERAFAALAEGGTVQMPLAATFFAGTFGTLRDRYGVAWSVIADPAGT